MKMRFIVKAILIGFIGVALGGFVVALNRNSGAVPIKMLFKFSDKINREISEFFSSDIPGPTIEYYPSIFTGIRGTVVRVPSANRLGTGGGIAVLGDEVLAMNFSGKVYSVNTDGKTMETAIELPDYGLDAYRDAAKMPPYDEFRHRFDRFRYNELEAFAGPAGRFLFVTYTEFHADDLCYTLSAARLSLSNEPLAEQSASSDDWEVIFRSQPCLPMRGINAAIQGEEAGGRIAFSRDGEHAFLAVGEYGWNGWDSDGRTELSTKRLAQANDADQGHIVDIDLNSLEVRHFSKGHRNPQGITVDTMGRIWAVEHGPRGGDELNLIQENRNYGWPVVTYGTDYSGSPIPGVEHLGFHTGFKGPQYAWLPSVGISGLTAQNSVFTPEWEGDLLAISLVGNKLFRIRLEGDDVRFAEEIDIGRRLRDIEQKDDGSIVIWTDNNEVIFLTAISGGFGEQHVQQYIDGLKVDSFELATSLEEAVEQCAECHSFSSGENRIGPSLAAVHGANIASNPGFDYSEVLSNASGRWTSDRLFAFIKSPDDSFVGTNMPKVNISDDRVVSEIVSLLEQLSQTDLRH